MEPIAEIITDRPPPARKVGRIIATLNKLVEAGPGAWLEIPEDGYKDIYSAQGAWASQIRRHKMPLKVYMSNGKVICAYQTPD